MAFVKLDCCLLDSTLWLDREARELFITALLMSEPFELRESQKQIEVRTLVETGFEVPVGWYGLVSAAGIGIVWRSHMDQEIGLAALERLCAPEAGTRTPDFEGRRMARISGGYIILNYIKYREKDHTSAERSKRYRARQLGKKGKLKLKAKKSGPLSGEIGAIAAVDSGEKTQEQADETASETREHQ